MNRYLRHYIRIFKLSLMNQVEFRGNFLMWTIVHTIILFSMIVFFQIVYMSVPSINGWSHYESLMVLGVSSLIIGLGSLTFFPFMYNFGQDVAEGNLDMRLTKPLDVHFQSAIVWVDIEDLSIVPTSVILIVFALIKLKPAHLLLNLTMGSVLIVASLVILFSILTLIQSLALKHVRADSVANFYWSLVTIGKYPTKAIRTISIFASIMLIPIALISSVPAETLFGRFDWLWIAGSIVSAVVLFVVSRKIFIASLRNYSSASS